MVLTGACKQAFLKNNSFTVQLLPENLKNLVIYRWFNTETKIGIDLVNWENDGFDYGVAHPYLNKVYQSTNHAGNRNKNFDKNLVAALIRANSIYNEK